MGKETLQTLAEVKMHVRDEHLAHTEMKTRLKRRFGTVDPSFTQQQGGPLPPSSSSSTQPGNIVEASQTTPGVPSISGGLPSTSSNPDTSDHAAGPNNEDTPADDQSTQLLSTIINQFIQQGELDGVEDSTPIASMHQPMTHPPVSLEELFDFSQDYWVTYHQKTGRRSLSEELEVYNLLDTDLPGEEGAEVAIDDTTGDILTLNV